MFYYSGFTAMLIGSGTFTIASLQNDLCAFKNIHAYRSIGKAKKITAKRLFTEVADMRVQ